MSESNRRQEDSISEPLLNSIVEDNRSHSHEGKEMAHLSHDEKPVNGMPQIFGVFGVSPLSFGSWMLVLSMGVTIAGICLKLVDVV